MTIEISDEIIDREIKKYIEKKISAEVRVIFDKKLQEEVEKREEKAYQLFTRKADEIFGARLNKVIERAVQDEMRDIFWRSRWGQEATDNDAFNEGVHIAYLAMSKFPSEKTIDKALEGAGKWLAHEIRMNSSRYKKLVEVLMENLQENSKQGV